MVYLSQHSKSPNIDSYWYNGKEEPVVSMNSFSKSLSIRLSVRKEGKKNDIILASSDSMFSIQIINKIFI